MGTVTSLRTQIGSQSLQSGGKLNREVQLAGSLVIDHCLAALHHSDHAVPVAIPPQSTLMVFFFKVCNCTATR